MCFDIMSQGVRGDPFSVRAFLVCRKYPQGLPCTLSEHIMLGQHSVARKSTWLNRRLVF